MHGPLSDVEYLIFISHLSCIEFKVANHFHWNLKVFAAVSQCSLLPHTRQIHSVYLSVSGKFLYVNVVKITICSVFFFLINLLTLILSFPSSSAFLPLFWNSISVFPLQTLSSLNFRPILPSSWLYRICVIWEHFWLYYIKAVDGRNKEKKRVKKIPPCIVISNRVGYC